MNVRRYCAACCPRCHLAGQKPVPDALTQLVQVTCYEMDMQASVTDNLLRERGKLYVFNAGGLNENDKKYNL